MTDSKPIEAEEDPPPDYVFDIMRAAYTLAADYRVGRALASLRFLQLELNPKKTEPLLNDTRAYEPDYIVVSQAIADILCIAGRLGEARGELRVLLNLADQNPGTLNMLAKISYKLAIGAADRPDVMCNSFRSSANYLSRALKSYADGFSEVDEQTLHELRCETHVVTLNLAAEVYERAAPLGQSEVYGSLLVTSAEIVGKLRGYELAETFLGRHEDIAPLNQRGLVTRAELQADLGQVTAARQTYERIATAPPSDSARTGERITNLNNRLRSLTAEI